MPKKSFMAEFSSRITPRKVSHLLAGWHTQLVGETIHAGESFNLDFHRPNHQSGGEEVSSELIVPRSDAPPIFGAAEEVCANKIGRLALTTVNSAHQSSPHSHPSQHQPSRF